jgi:hypothetical protein
MTPSINRMIKLLSNEE